MRIVCDSQRTEEWEHWRNRPTASNFSRFITPAKGAYSKQATDYACELVAKEMGVFVEPPPSFAMQWGIDHEEEARTHYAARTNNAVEEVGFVVPDDTDSYGCSPDGLVGDDGLLEIKCPQAPTLIRYHADGVLPDTYKPQIQGQLLITGRAWCDFFAWYPGLQSFLLRVDADIPYQEKIAECLEKLLVELDRVKAKLNPLPF